MNKVLFNSKEEHWAWVWKNYISLYGKINEEGHWEEASIWEEEDLPKLQPFFEWNDERKGAPGSMPPEVRESFDFYMTKHLAAGEKKYRKDVCGEVEQDRLLEILGFMPIEEECEEEDGVEYLHNPAYSADSVLELNEDYEISYPCVMVYYIDTSWDRAGGQVTMTFVDFVSLKEFNQQK